MSNDHMDNNTGSFTWYLVQRQDGSKGFHFVDNKQQWSFDLELHDWGICPEPTLPMLSFPCSLWILFMESSGEGLNYDE